VAIVHQSEKLLLAMKGTSMSIRRVVQKVLCSIGVGTAFLAAMNFAVGIPMVRMALAAKGGEDKNQPDQDTKTPIKRPSTGRR
jgi:hypothetical protein